MPHKCGVWGQWAERSRGRILPSLRATRDTEGQCVESHDQLGGVDIFECLHTWESKLGKRRR